MKEYVLAVNSEKETNGLGQKLGSLLEGGEYIELIGALGSGKTTFVKAVLKGAGVKDAGSSPTFVIDAVHETKKQNPALIHHIDFYRLEDPDELITLGIHDAISDPESSVLVEWADKFELNLGSGKLRVEIKVKNKDKREFYFEAYNNIYENLLQNLVGNIS